jgi:hypothetical protein
MKEVVFYSIIEAGFESFPAENYVDYMTNVMPVPERHIFSIPKLQISIVCMISEKPKNPTRLWTLVYEVLSNASSTILEIEENQIMILLNVLQDAVKPDECSLCEDTFGVFIRKTS